MTIYTELQPTATPGKKHSFLPKSGTAPGSHTGLFTSLSVSALPGRRHSFTAKGPSAPVTHTGLFTELSAMALPGRRHSFTAKALWIPEIVIPIPPVVEPAPPERRGGNLLSASTYEERRRSYLYQARDEDKIVVGVIKLFLREINM